MTLMLGDSDLDLKDEDIDEDEDGIVNDVSSVCEDSSDAEFRADRFIRESTLDDEAVHEDTIVEDDEDLDDGHGRSDVSTPVADLLEDDTNNNPALDRTRLSSTVSFSTSITTESTDFLPQSELLLPDMTFPKTFGLFGNGSTKRKVKPKSLKATPPSLASSSSPLDVMGSLQELMLSARGRRDSDEITLKTTLGAGDSDEVVNENDVDNVNNEEIVDEDICSEKNMEVLLRQVRKRASLSALSEEKDLFSPGNNQRSASVSVDPGQDPWTAAELAAALSSVVQGKWLFALYSIVNCN